MLNSKPGHPVEKAFIDIYLPLLAICKYKLRSLLVKCKLFYEKIRK